MNAVRCPWCCLPHDGACHPDLLAVAEDGRVALIEAKAAPLIADRAPVAALLGFYFAVFASVSLTVWALATAVRWALRVAGVG